MDINKDEIIYSMDSILTGINGYEGKTVQDVINEGNGNKEIFKLIKRGYRFNDDVLKQCRISRSIRDGEAYWEIVKHAELKPSKKLKKDTAKYEEIVESLSHVEVEENESEDENDEMSEFFANDDE